MLASRLLLLVFFGSESGCLGLEKQGYGKGCISKINFTEVGFLMIQALFLMILGGLGTNFPDFCCCSGDGFDIRQIFMAAPGTPRSSQHAWVVVTPRFLALILRP